ncbi:MAG: hypothetical protein JSS82_07860 [Bacteroidetes bacterium]|nr:hypothetical protein [Bacteroidota bacterium]
MKGDFNTSVGFISWDTDHPPDPTVESDIIVAAEVCLFLIINFTAIVCVLVYRKNYRIRFARPWSLCFMILGGSIHIVSVFISNGYFNSFWFFDFLRTVWCPLWDFWMSFAFGYNSWVLSHTQPMYMWYTYMKTQQSIGNAQIMHRSVCKDRPDLGIETPEDDYLGDEIEKRNTKMNGENALFLILTGAPIFVICCIVSFADATEYDEHTGWCETVLAAKILLLCWISGTIIILITLLAITRKIIRKHPTLKMHYMAYEERKLSLVVGLNILIVLILINISGISVSWWGRFIDINLLMIMYLVSFFVLIHPAFSDWSNAEEQDLQASLFFCYEGTSDISFSDVKDDSAFFEAFIKFMNENRTNYYVDRRSFDVAMGKMADPGDLQFMQTIENKDEPSMCHMSDIHPSYLDMTHIVSSEQLMEFYVECLKYDSNLRDPNSEMINLDMSFITILKKFFSLEETDVNYQFGSRLQNMENMQPESPKLTHNTYKTSDHVLLIPMDDLSTLYIHDNEYHRRTKNRTNPYANIMKFCEFLLDRIWMPQYRALAFSEEKINEIRQRRAYKIAVRQGLVEFIDTDEQTATEQKQEYSEVVQSEPDDCTYVIEDSDSEDRSCSSFNKNVM